MRARRPGAALAPGLRVVAHLRRGTDLDVYDAWSDDLGARCVVKALRPDRRADRRAAAALVREGRLLLRLSHPHLVRAHALVRGPSPLVVLEVVGGETLGHRLEHERLAPREAAVLGLHVGSALGYLHRREIVHLDVKPSNVVLEGGRARLLDLSVARRPGPLPRAGIGTAGYRAPEQERGRTVTAAADVWGLGVLLYEAVAGDEPFGPRGSNGSSPRLRNARPRVPRALDAVVAACLRSEPADRPPLVDVLGALEGLAGVAVGERRFAAATQACCSST